MLEQDLRQPVDAWLRDLGCHVVRECEVAYHRCDLVGIVFARQIGRRIPELEVVVAVELKLARITEVLEQGAENREGANYSYAAMPATLTWKMRPATFTRFENAGVGLIAVDEQNARVVLPAPDNDPGICDRIRRNLWRRTRDQRTDGRLRAAKSALDFLRRI